MFVLENISHRSFQKTQQELLALQKSAHILQCIFNQIEALIVPYQNPRDIRKTVLYLAKNYGADMQEQYILFGRHGYVHAHWCDEKPLEPGEIFTLDMWLSYDGWYADMARPYQVGQVTPQQKQLYWAALHCQQAAINIIKAGIPYIHLVEAVRKQAKIDDCFILEEACGHGIGRELHEEPTIGFTYAAKNLFDAISANLVITIEIAVSLKPSYLVEQYNGTVFSHDGQDVLYAEAMVAVLPDKPLVLCR